MEITRLFRVETVHRGGRTEARRHLLAARQIETSQSQKVVGLAEAINSLPNPLQRASFHLCLKGTPADEGKDLAAGCNALLDIEKPFEFWVHSEIVGAQWPRRQPSKSPLWINGALWTLTCGERPQKPAIYGVLVYRHGRSRCRGTPQPAVQGNP